MEDTLLLGQQCLPLRLAAGTLLLQLADLREALGALLGSLQQLAAFRRAPDRFLQPYCRCLDIRFTGAAQTLLLRFQRAQCRLIVLDPAAELKGQLIPVLLQMKETLEHLSAVHTPQR
ncbi:hypothetical protein D3C75_883900 [compost metagenome]